MAARCTHYLKPLLEAGTQGTRGSASVFMPHVTEGYRGPASAAEDAPDPVCTVRYFPSTAAHTVQVGSTPETPTPHSSVLSCRHVPHLTPCGSFLPNSGPGMSLRGSSVCLPRPSTAPNSKATNGGGCESRVPNTRVFRT